MVSPTSSATERLLEALQNDPQTKDAPIDASFSQGIVTLTGVVKSEKILRAAEEIARSQPGVISVVNEINVK